MLDFKIYLDDVEKCLKAAVIPGEANRVVDRLALLGVFRSLSDSFEAHYKRASDDLAYIFSGNRDVAYQTDMTVALLGRWGTSDDPVSMTVIVSVALEFLGFDEPSDKSYILPMLMATVLGEIPNNHPYHNNAHFRKVVLQMLRMIVVHNDVYSGGAGKLGKEQIAKLVIAAAIHDLGHCGKKSNNMIDRVYHMAKVEKLSFDFAAPYLSVAGLSDEVLADIRTMLISTDVAPFGDPISPTNQIRRAYKYHYGSDDDDDDDEPLALSRELEGLEERDDLCLLCMMLHEADIFTSAAVCYDVTCQESIAISEEMGMLACPEQTYLFLEKICPAMLSPSADILGSCNLEVIRSRVEEAYKNGNKIYQC